MSVFLQALTGFGAAIVAPFLIQFLKKRTWKATKAKWLAFAVSAVAGVLWVILSGAAGKPTGSFATLEWCGWLLGAATVVYTTATAIYRWFEEKVFKKLPTLQTIIEKATGAS